jgi:hypothetical protein
MRRRLVVLCASGVARNPRMTAARESYRDAAHIVQANPARRFTFAEQAFFQRWWNEQVP